MTDEAIQSHYGLNTVMATVNKGDKSIDYNSHIFFLTLLLSRITTIKMRAPAPFASSKLLLSSILFLLLLILPSHVIGSASVEDHDDEEDSSTPILNRPIFEDSPEGTTARRKHGGKRGGEYLGS